MAKQLIERPRSVLLLAAVALVLTGAATTSAQGQSARPGAKPGRVKLIDTLSGNKYLLIRLVAFTDAGKGLDSVGVDSNFQNLEIKSWDVATRKVTATTSRLEPSTDWAISPDGKILAVPLWGVRDKPTKIRLYDLRQMNKPQEIDIDYFAPGPVVFSPDGKVLAWAEQKRIRLWNLTAKKLIGTLTATSDVRSMAFGPGGKTLATGGGDSATLWNVSTGNETKTFEVPNKRAVYIVVFSPDGKTLAVAANDPVQKEDPVVKLWDVATGKETSTLTGHVAGVSSLAFNKDGKILAVGTYKGKVKLWNATTAKDLITLGLHDGAVFGLAFSPDGRTLASAGDDKTIQLWELPPEPHTYQRLELYNPILKE